MKIRRLKIADLRPAAYNPRRISPAALARLERSIDTFGLVDPIVVNRRTGWTVVSGHQRLKVLAKRGATAVDCVIVDLSPAREKALNVALNNPSIAGEWDERALAKLLRELQGPDLDLTGFDVDEVDKILRGVEADDDRDEQDLDAAPALPRRAVSRPGDVWELGPHVVVCGDSTRAETYEAFGAGGRRAQVLFTDPPYGVSYQAQSGKHARIKNDEAAGDDLATFLSQVLQRAVPLTAKTAAFYVWHASSTREEFALAMKGAGLQERQQIIWAKPGFVLGRSDYQWSHELCFYASRAGISPYWAGGRAAPTVWRVAVREGDTLKAWIGPGLALSDGAGDEVTILPGNHTGTSKSARRIRVARGKQILLAGDTESSTVWEVSRDRAPDHPTQKPVELALIALRNSSRPGEAVLDPFLGSGGTLVAAQHLERICWGVELEPAYVDVVIARWQKMAGGGRRARNRTRPDVRITT